MIKPLFRNTPKKKKKSKVLVYIATFLIVLLAFSYLFVYLPAMRIKAKGTELMAAVNQMKVVAKENDIDKVKNQMKEIESKYEAFKKESKSVYWMSFIPYVADFKNGVEAGDYMVQAGKETIDAIYPYADLIGFKQGESSFVEKSAEDRLQTAVLTLDKVLGKLDVISADIDEAQKRIEKIDPNRYPENFGGREIRSNLIQAKEQFQGVAALFVDAKPLLKNLPKILGKDKEMKYLILFQNENEQRATGGFLTAYAVFKIREGKMTIQDSEDIYSLDNSISSHPAAPKEIRAYHKGVSQFFIRDSNLSPDFVKSIDLFNSLYQKSSQRIDYDGIITLDSRVLVDMLTIYGDTEAGGVQFSAKLDKRCDCPQVIYSLFDMVDRPVAYIKADRKGILGDLMYALFYKALGFSPSKYWGILAQTMFKNLDEKHILMYFTDPSVQQAVEKLNYAGRVRDYKGDYLLIANVNFAGAKSNLFVTKELTSETKKADGKIERTVTMVYRNPYPHSDCNLERGGLCLNAILRNWVRVYVPQGSKLVNFKGSETQVKTYDELNKTVFEGFLRVNPLGKSEIVVTYTLPESIDSNNYNLYVQKQSGESKEKLEVRVGGKKVYDNGFEKDQEIKAKL